MNRSLFYYRQVQFDYPDQKRIRQNVEVMDLSLRKCVPCEGGTSPFIAEQVTAYLKGLEEGWTVVENKLVREFRFKDYGQTMDFVNKVAGIADAENHHPLMHVYYAKAVVELWTHAIGGLSENDFILAAKIDRIKMQV